jgi:hypothetical protein
LFSLFLLPLLKMTLTGFNVSYSYMHRKCTSIVLKVQIQTPKHNGKVLHYLPCLCPEPHLGGVLPFLPLITPLAFFQYLQSFQLFPTLMSSHTAICPLKFNLSRLIIKDTFQRCPP